MMLRRTIIDTPIPTIFLIDDDEVEHKLIARMLKKNEVANPLVTARDGAEALEMLAAGSVPSPRLILLDLNMPRMNGFEFLDKLAEIPGERLNVVFVFSTSSTDDDRARAWSRNIAGYFVKPVDTAHYEAWCHMILEYLRLVRLPS